MMFRVSKELVALGLVFILSMWVYTSLGLVGALISLVLLIVAGLIALKILIMTGRVRWVGFSKRRRIEDEPVVWKKWTPPESGLKKVGGAK
jgi:hypothetical protein